MNSADAYNIFHIEKNADCGTIKKIFTQRHQFYSQEIAKLESYPHLASMKQKLCNKLTEIKEAYELLASCTTINEPLNCRPNEPIDEIDLCKQNLLVKKKFIFRNIFVGGVTLFILITVCILIFFSSEKSEKISALSKASLAIITDADCVFSIDDSEKIGIRKWDTVSIYVELGKHYLLVENRDGSVNLKDSMTWNRTEKKVYFTKLQQLINETIAKEVKKSVKGKINKQPLSLYFKDGFEFIKVRDENETLFTLAQKKYKNKFAWPIIYKENRDSISNTDNKLYGKILKIRQLTLEEKGKYERLRRNFKLTPVL